MSNGVFKSTDGGTTWSAMGIGSAVPALAIDPSAPDTVYAGAETQVYKSTDGAHTWRNTGLVAAATSLGIDPTGRFLLAANQDSDSVVSFRIDAKSGKLQPTGHVAQVPTPVCVKFLPAR
jgi:hypothetical protein